MATYKLTKPAKEHLLIDGKDVVQKMEREEMRKIMEEPITRFRFGDGTVKVWKDFELTKAARLLRENKPYLLAIIFEDMYEADIKKKLKTEKSGSLSVERAISDLMKNNPSLTTKDILTDKDTVSQIIIDSLVNKNSNKRKKEASTTFRRYGDGTVKVWKDFELTKAARVLRENKPYLLAIIFEDMYEADIKKKLKTEKSGGLSVEKAISDLMKANPSLTTKDILTDKDTVSQIIIDSLVNKNSNKRTIRKTDPVKPLVGARRKPNSFVRDPDSKKTLNLTHVFKKGEAKLATTKSKRKVDLSKLVSKVQGNYN